MSGPAGTQANLDGANFTGVQAVPSGSTSLAAQAAAGVTGPAAVTARTAAGTSATTPADQAPSTIPTGAMGLSGQDVHGVDLFFASAGAGQQQWAPPSPAPAGTTAQSGQGFQSVDLLVALARQRVLSVLGYRGWGSVSQPDDGLCQLFR
jgi:hypothetical protein